MASYTSETLIEAVTQVTITVSSVPTTAQVDEWIDEIEAVISENALGSHDAIDQYVEVPSQQDVAWYWSVTWTPRTDALRFHRGSGGYLVPLTDVKGPIIAISSLSKNDQDYSSAASWDALTEGPAAGSSYLLLQSGLRNAGYALYFYDDIPLVGPKRIKMTYTYGRNLDSEILQRWCTLKVAQKVLVARMGTSSPDGLSELQGEGFNTYLPTQYKKRIEEYRKEISEIEKDFFKKQNEVPSAILGG